MPVSETLSSQAYLLAQLISVGGEWGKSVSEGARETQYFQSKHLSRYV